MLLIRLLFINILLFNSLADNPKVNTIFISPVRIPVLLSANFGELRIDHFHSGLDIKTQGVIGKEVVSAADGYIYRISVSPGGFGKALYVKHQSGYSTVYGHLDKFSQEIEEYVKGQQYEKKSYLITLFPDRDRFVVRQGDIIAYSGNSGSSGGPHLHFEIRKSDNEIPVNPLLFGFGPEDTLQPVIEKVVIYPANSNTVINNNNSAKKISVYGSRGKYYIPSDNEIRISGLAGFGIKTYDLLNDSHNKCAVYTIELKIDSISIFSYVMNGFSFNESRYINSHIDYETYMRDKIYIERAYILPNNKLRAYKDIRNKGIFNFNDDRKHYAEITVTDAYNNKSSLSFNIKSDSSIKEKAEEIPDKNLTIMPFNKSNKFSSENMAIEIPEGALYDTLCFSFRKCEGTRDMLSDLYHIHNKFTPLHKECKLSIKPISVPPGKKAKMVIVHLGDDLKKSALYSSWEGEYLTANVLALGKYYIGIDSVAPVISANGFVNGENLSGKREIRIRITDEFSGIKSYEPAIDEKWALFEYDQKNEVLIYRFDENRIMKGTKHTLLLKVTDNKNNISLFSRNFTW